MDHTRLLYDQYKYEKDTAKEGVQTDMIRRIEDYRRNVNLYNTLRTVKSNTSISSQTDIETKSQWFE